MVGMDVAALVVDISSCTFKDGLAGNDAIRAVSLRRLAAGPRSSTCDGGFGVTSPACAETSGRVPGPAVVCIWLVLLVMLQFFGFALVVNRPEMLGIWSGVDQKGYGSGMSIAGMLVTMFSRCVLFVCRQARIMVGLDQHGPDSACRFSSGCRLPRCGAEANPDGRPVLSDDRDSAVPVHRQGGGRSSAVFSDV